MLSSFLRLAKVFLSLAIAFSTLAGYVIYSGAADAVAVAVAAGVFLLSAAAGALNQYQERNLDRLMERTATRPIPAGRIKPSVALWFAFVTGIAGAVVLFLAGGFVAMVLGIFNLAWYNLVYTPLKTRTAFAVAAGALNGAVPPVIGWVAAGGALFDPEILFIAFFILIWQIPHFWLLLLQYGEQYEKAGYRSVTGRLTPSSLKWVILLWVAATSVTTLFLPMFGIVRNTMVIVSMLTANCMLILMFVLLFARTEGPPAYRTAFIGFNIFMMIVFGLLIADALVR